jgi:type IV secretory pathway VirB2 component (pilin)
LDHLSAPSSVRERPGWMLLLAVVATVLMALPAVAMAQTDIFNLPVVDEIVCGFVSYARGKLAPMLAVGVVILAIIGHWLGVAKMWSQVLYVGIGLGVIMGIATAFARYGTMGSSCIS